MRGERPGQRRSDAATRAQGTTGDQQSRVDGWKALADLAGLVRRSHAPHLTLRLASAIGLTLGGKALGVLAPLVLGAAVNRLAAG